MECDRYKKKTSKGIVQKNIFVEKLKKKKKEEKKINIYHVYYH